MKSDHIPASPRHRTLLQGAGALTFAPWLLQHAAAADQLRFALGVASGQPRADGMVLWTRLTGGDLEECVKVRWELAEDEAFRKVVASSDETAEAAWAHSVHAEPTGLARDRWYWYRRSAPTCASPAGSTGDAWPAFTSSMSWQYRDVQVCAKAGRGGSNTVSVAECPELLDPWRTLLGTEQERWLAEGWDTRRPWNLLAQQTLMARYVWSDPANAGGVYWTDGWDGYAPARNRLLGGVAERAVPDVVVLGGDVHSHDVADLKADFDDAKSPIVATEFCGTSITSPGLAQARIDAARPFNPHVHSARDDQRGYMSLSLGTKRLDARLRAVDSALDPASGTATVARFAVDAARPGTLVA